jgi:RNA polymerase sigma-70 factor (ECF subfamily)
MTSVDVAAEFETHRGLLLGIAYRMLGTVADAEDVLQEAMVRWVAADRSFVESPRAFLVTIVSRLCLDALGSARVKRETYVGPWLPEPVVTEPAADPEQVSLAFLLMLERLSPAERAAFLLAEVFEYSFAEVASILGKSEEACRQLASRGKKHLRDGRPKPVNREEHERVLTAFMAACGTGDLAGLEALFAAGVSVHSDGGGKVHAARNVVRGANACARLMLGLTRRAAPGSSVDVGVVNGLPAVLVRTHGAPAVVLSLDVRDGLVQAIYLVNNPEKLRLLPLSH